MGVGGYWNKVFKEATSRYPLYTHGLSLSVGSPDLLDMAFLTNIKQFLKETNARIYSEHLSFSKCDNAHLYDLLPIPFTGEAVSACCKKDQAGAGFSGTQNCHRNRELLHACCRRDEGD
ncbi:MAG: DUF692 family protein [Bacteroidota bacterium]|nr:DUF692 family protein [Bacteroidota bacterium]